MLTALLITLFAAAGFLALGSIGHCWKQYGAAWRKLRGDLAACATHREIRYTLITTELRNAPAVSRPAFRPVVPLQAQPWPRAA